MQVRRRMAGLSDSLGGRDSIHYVVFHAHRVRKKRRSPTPAPHNQLRHIIGVIYLYPCTGHACTESPSDNT